MRDSAREATFRRLAALCLVLATVGFALFASIAVAREVIAYFGTEVGSGSFGGEFDVPSGVAVNTSGAGPADAGDLYVIDAGNDRVQRIAQDDSGTLGDPFDDSFSFVAAWGADVDSSVMGGASYEICTAVPACKSGAASSGDGTVGGNGALADLRDESGIAVDQDTGNVYVPDRGNNRINVYGGDGTFLRSFGFDVVASGPDDTGTGYEICVAANGDVCKAGVEGSGLGQIGFGANGITVSPPDGNPTTGMVFLSDSGNVRVDTYALDGSGPSSFGSGAEFGTPLFDIAVDSRGIVYVSYFDGSGQVIARYDSQNANAGGVGFLAPIVVPPLAISPNTGNRQVSGLEVDPDSDGAGPDTDILYVLRNLGPEPETVVQQFGPVNAPGLTAPPAAEDTHHGSAAGFNFVNGLGLDDRTGRLFVSTNQNIAGPSSLPEDNHGVYVLDTAGTLPTATLDSLSDITISSVTLNGTDWTRGPEILLGTQADPQSVSVRIEPPQGLLPGTFYHVRLVVTKRFAIPVPSNELTFTILASAPLVETVGAPVRSATAATLNGRVNPRLAPTQFHFEYVTASQFAASGFAGAQSTPTQTVGVNEVQKITVIGTSGQFKLTFEGQTTPDDLPFDASAAAVQSALEALPVIGAGNVKVQGGGLDSSGNRRPYTVVFSGDLAATDVSDITASDGTVPLDDDAGGTVTTLTQGGGGNNEVQQLTIKAAGGSFRLTFGSQTTPTPIEFSAGALQIQNRLSNLSSIGKDKEGKANVAVSGGPGSPSGATPYVIEFIGERAGKDVGQLSVSDNPAEPLVIAKGLKRETAVQGGPANLNRLVSARVAGLTAATTYLYRVVADNGNPGSPATGNAMSVTTRASAAPLTHGDFPGPIGSDRAYEQINLPDTGGNPVTGAGPFAGDGNRAIYTVTGGTPVSETGTEFNQHFAERRPTGWQTLNIFPPRSVLLGANLQLIAQKPDFSAVYAVNTTAGGEISVWRLSPHAMPEKLWEPTAGQSPSDSPATGVRLLPTVATQTERIAAMLRGTNLDPAFPLAEGEVDNIYDVSSGATPQLLSLMPDGSLAECGVAAARPFELSDDGSRLFFASSDDDCGSRPNLYLRNVDTAQTKLLSGPVLSGPDCGATMVRTTNDAAFFFTQSRLAAEDTSAAPGCPENSDGDVYRYDLATDAIDCVTCLTVLAGVDADVSVPFNFGVPSPRATIAVAEAGSRVYFQSPHPLLPGTPTTGGRRSLYVTKPASGELRWVGPVDFGQGGADNAMTPDGAVIRFRSDELALNPVGGTDNGGTVQDYRYDDRDHSLVCVSCPIDGSEPVGPVSTLDRAGISDDGNFLAFATPTPLVAADQNTAPAGEDPAEGMDVYEWRDGRLFMITDGLTKWPREFESPSATGISPSGQNLYFFVAAQLTPDALDGYRRLYTARIGGGIVFPKPPLICPLEVCQGTPRGAPQKPYPLTVDARGTGNLPKKVRRCPKGKRKVCRHGKVRCIKRRANRNRRAAR